MLVDVALIVTCSPIPRTSWVGWSAVMTLPAAAVVKEVTDRAVPVPNDASTPSSEVLTLPKAARVVTPAYPLLFNPVT